MTKQFSAEVERALADIDRDTIFVVPERVDGKPFDLRPGALNIVDAEHLNAASHSITEMFHNTGTRRRHSRSKRRQH